MDRGTLVATVSGGSIAITGTVPADCLRHRREDDRGVGARRRTVYIEFISAAGVCHARCVRSRKTLTVKPTWTPPPARH